MVVSPEDILCCVQYQIENSADIENLIRLQNLIFHSLPSKLIYLSTYVFKKFFCAHSVMQKTEIGSFISGPNFEDLSVLKLIVVV